MFEIFFFNLYFFHPFSYRGSTFFGKNIIEKRNIFGFKKLKLNNENRLFKKELGGGSILDLGCYPSSLSLLIASIKSNNLNDKIKLNNIKKFIGPTNVDLEAFANIDFNNEFNSYIGSSFKSNLGKITKIFGSKGEIVVPDSWHCENSKIIVIEDDLVFSTQFYLYMNNALDFIEKKKISGMLVPGIIQLKYLNRVKISLFYGII